ncbi:MAG: HIT domain-containing protein [Janthinobacterium lividum]
MGGHGGQEVPHLHVHLFGGAPLGVMIARTA